jgi:hypothetical protein
VSGAKYLRTNGSVSIKLGEKIITFVDKYEPDGIIPKCGTNCILGVKVMSWKDPIVTAIEALNNDQMALRVLLKDESYRRVWQEVDPGGLEEYGFLP